MYRKNNNNTHIL